VEGRDFTLTEQRMIQRMLAVVFEELEKAWSPVHPLKLEYVRSEMNTQFANIATPNEIVVVTTYSIELGAAGGEFHIFMPYSMLEPIRDVLCSALQGEQMDVDKRWVKLLSKQVQSADVELVVNFGHAELTVQQLLNMQLGDVISLEVARPLLAEVDAVPVMECKCGVFNGQYALQVERLLPSGHDN
jgi:flagellar motor switch protein FliM